MAGQALGLVLTIKHNAQRLVRVVAAHAVFQFEVALAIVTHVAFWNVVLIGWTVVGVTLTAVDLIFVGAARFSNFRWLLGLRGDHRDERRSQ